MKPSYRKITSRLSPVIVIAGAGVLNIAAMARDIPFIVKATPKTKRKNTLKRVLIIMIYQRKSDAQVLPGRTLKSNREITDDKVQSHNDEIAWYVDQSERSGINERMIHGNFLMPRDNRTL